MLALEILPLIMYDFPSNKELQGVPGYKEYKVTRSTWGGSFFQFYQKQK